MEILRKAHFDESVQSSPAEKKPGVWELPDDVLDSVSGGECKKVGDVCFRQYVSFCQNSDGSSCF